MEHILHLFGGGCGEHLAIPAILSTISGGWIWLKIKLSRSPSKNKLED